MKVSMHAMSVDLFAHTLGNLSSILEKAAASATQRKFDPAVLLAARLAPDMLPLTRQVQIATDIAKNAIARLAAQDPPRFEDTETTIEQLRARLARAAARSWSRYLRTAAGPGQQVAPRSSWRCRSRSALAA